MSKERNDNKNERKPSFKKGLEQYIKLCGKLHGKAATDDEYELLHNLFMNYGIMEEARVQMGAVPTFTDEEYDAIFNEGQAMQD